MKEKMSAMISSVIFRIMKNPHTTFGGGTLGGVALAALISKLEEMSGCRFAVAFGNIDWGQITVFVVMQVFGAFTTDSNKTVPVVTPQPQP